MRKQVLIGQDHKKEHKLGSVLTKKIIRPAVFFCGCTKQGEPAPQHLIQQHRNIYSHIFKYLFLDWRTSNLNSLPYTSWKGNEVTARGFGPMIAFTPFYLDPDQLTQVVLHFTIVNSTHVLRWSQTVTGLSFPTCTRWHA